MGGLLGLEVGCDGYDPSGLGIAKYGLSEEFRMKRVAHSDDVELAGIIWMSSRCRYAISQICNHLEIDGAT